MTRDNETPGTEMLTVDLGDRSYPIHVGAGILEDHLGKAFTQYCDARAALIVTDEHVGPLYEKAATESLKAAGIATASVTVPAGEKSKSFEGLNAVYDALFAMNAERRDAVVALGGGVVGDLAGFAAGTFKRGMRFIQVPTTLLAMVDSSIGGKTGINHVRGKNMIGVFHQPAMVFADTATLKTLPGEQLGCGLAETVKHAVIRDTAFFEELSQQVSDILALDAAVMGKLVVRNCRIKAAVVSADEREAGLRGILNFGHTVGHGIEAAMYGKFHHGQAVALGMAAAGRLSVERELMTVEQLERMTALLTAFGLPTAIKETVDVDAIYEAMKQDKKVTGGKMRFVLAEGIGNCRFTDDLDEKQIKAVIASLVVK